MRNPIICKRYADKEITLNVEVQFFEDGTEKVKSLKDDKHFDEFAKIIPVEIARGKKLYAELDSK